MTKMQMLVGMMALSGAVGVLPLQAADNAWSTAPNDNTFTGLNWTLGTQVPGAPTGTIAAGDSLYFGTSGTTTLTNDEPIGFGIGGFTFNSGAPAYIIGGNSFALNGNIANNSANLQTVNNPFAFSGARSFSTTTGNLALGGNLTGTALRGSVLAGGGGTVTLGGTNAFTSNGGQQHNDISGGSTLLITGASTFTLGDSDYIAVGSGTAGTAPGTMTIASGGTVNVNQSGGNTRFIVGTFGPGILNVNGNLNLATNAQLLLGYGGTSTVNLNTGGTITSASVIGNYNTNNGATLFNFNGGTLKANANQTNWLQGSATPTTVTTSSNSSTVDANNFAVSINSVVGDGATAGGLTITDSSAAKGGVVTLGGANTYSGTTSITGGTLATNKFAANGTASGLGTGSAVTLNGGTLRNIGGPNGLNRTITVGANGGTLDLPGNGVLFFDGVLAGSGPVTFLDSSNGNHQWLYRFSSGGYTGNITIGNATAGSGFVQYRSGNANPFGTGTITVNAGGTFSADNGDGNGNPSLLSNLFTLNGGLLATQVPDMTYSGAISLAATSAVGHTANGSGNVTLSGIVSGAGGLNAVGGTKVTLTGANTYSGVTSISNNTTLQVSNNGTTAKLGTGSVTDNGALLFNRANAITVDNLISGSGTVSQTGSGTLTLTATNTYTGATTILNGGTLATNNLQANGTASGIGQGTALTLNNGTLQYTGVSNNSFNRAITLGAGGGTIDQSGSGFLFADGVITGAGSLTKKGASQLILRGANNYTGGTFINAGEVQIRNASLGPNNYTANVTVANGAVLAAGGGLTGSLAYNLTLNGNGNGNGALQEVDGGTNVTWLSPITLASDSGIGGSQNYTISGAIGGVGALTKLSGNTITLTGTGTYTGATTISSGTLQLGDGTTDGNIATSGSIVNNGALVLNRSTGTFSYNNVISGSGGISKVGAGTQLLNGANTYTGNTVVSGGVLGGTGNLSATSFAAGTTHAPGVSGPGIQNVNGNYLNNGVLSLDITGGAAGSGYDQVNVTGTVSLGGSLSVSSPGFTAPPGQSLVLINNDGNDAVTGTFTGQPQGSTLTIGNTNYSLSYTGGDGNDVVLTTAPSTVVISELRASGPQGTLDEFIELANLTGAPIDISDWTLTSSSGLLVAFSAGTSIKAGGHFLLTNAGSGGANDGYSLSSNPAYAFAVGDASYTGDLTPTATLTLQNGGTTIDTVGASTVQPGSATNQYSFVRRLESGFAKDTNTDASDFNLVDTGATASTSDSTGVGPLTAPRLGAPGPQSSASPIQRNSQVTFVPINAATFGTPSDGRYASKGSALDSPNGRQTLRRTITNNSTTTTVTQLRFRIVAATSGTTGTSGVADLRALTSAGVTIGGTKVVQGITLEAPSSPTVAPSGFGPNTASAGNGGGLNASWIVNLTAGSPLLLTDGSTAAGGIPPGKSINVEFLFGIVSNGTYRIVVDTELLP